MKVTVIIVTYNSEKTIETCLNSLIENSTFKQIIVVDNNSTDATVEILQKYNDIKIIENKENFGFGKANNLAAKVAEGEMYLFLNPDTEIIDGSLEKMEEFLESNEKTGVVGPKLLNPDGSLQREMAPFPNLLSQILILLKLHRFKLFEPLVYPNYNYEKTQEVEHLMGAALLVRKLVFDEVGGFDPKFFLWFEETDLLKRITNKGFKVYYYPDALVKHIGSFSISKLAPIKRQSFWNQSLLYYFKKHKGTLKTVLLFPFIILSYPIALIASLIKGR